MTNQFIEKTDVFKNSNSAQTQYFKKISFQKKFEFLLKKYKKNLIFRM